MTAYTKWIQKKNLPQIYFHFSRKTLSLGKCRLDSPLAEARDIRANLSTKVRNKKLGKVGCNYVVNFADRHP